jgi:hypothetical protein
VSAGTADNNTSAGRSVADGTHPQSRDKPKAAAPMARCAPGKTALQAHLDGDEADRILDLRIAQSGSAIRDVADRSWQFCSRPLPGQDRSAPLLFLFRLKRRRAAGIEMIAAREMRRTRTKSGKGLR